MRANLFVPFGSISQHRGLIIAIGAMQIVLGILAFSMAGITTIASVLYLGVLMLFFGGSQMYYAFKLRRAEHPDSFGFHLLLSVLYLIGGAFLVWNPVVNAAALTLLIAAVLMISGFVRAISSAVDRFTQWGWTFASGVCSVILGALIMRTWPESAVWTIGTFVGLDILFQGIFLLFVGIRSKTRAV